MSYYGIVLTRRGRELISKVLATSKPLEITGVMVGSGECPEDTFPGELTGLVEPVAEGTSTVPSYNGDTIRMTVEYRSDLNGGLERGFWLREFCVMAKDPDPDEGEDEKVMLVYGCLCDYPQYVSAYSEGRIDTRRFPICIVIGEGANVVIDFSPEAFMTAEDVQEYCVTVILPNLLEEMRRMVSEHNLSDEAHPTLRNAFSNMDSRLTLLEMMYNKDVTGNPFSVTFEDLEDVTVEGVWNQTMARIEF